jgi:hypothetical protein
MLEIYAQPNSTAPFNGIVGCNHAISKQILYGFLSFWVVHSLPMASFDPDTAMDCLRRMEDTVLGLKQVRGLLPNSPAREMLDALIIEAEQHIAEVKRKVIQ